MRIALHYLKQETCMKILCNHCKHFFKVDQDQSSRVRYSKCKSVFRMEIHLKSPCPHCKTELKVITDEKKNFIGIPKDQPFPNETKKSKITLPPEKSDTQLEDRVRKKIQSRSESFQRYSVHGYKKPPTIAKAFQIPNLSNVIQRTTQPKIYLTVLTIFSLLCVYGIMKSVFKSDETFNLSSNDTALEETLDEFEPIHHEDATGGPSYPSDDRKAGLGDETIKKINSNLQILHLPPLKQVTSTYGIRLDPFTKKLAFHAGVDFKADMGTKIEAAMDGTVKYVGPKGMYGYVVILKHINGYETLYGHLSKTLVQKNQKIKQNDIIALAGSTGRSTGAHLHFELMKNGKKIDPLQANLLKLKTK